LNTVGQQIVEQKVIEQLEREKNKKKTVIENKYRYRAESGILELDEDLIDRIEYTEGREDVREARSVKKARLACEEVVVQDDGDSEWIDCEESWDLIREEMIDINIKCKRRRRIHLMMLSKNADRMERNYRSYRARQNVERMQVGL
jgi:hypothetical protein